jgi:glycosyltransferase involved in cell wall biosynthesis
MAHSHPRLTRGGAEISADALFRGLGARGAKTWFLACGGAGSESRLGAALTQPFSADDYLYSPGVNFDYFKFANPDPQFPRALEELAGSLRPDIVHAHHYTRFGVECFSVIRRASPNTRIVLSLHEYLAICHHNGQMVKTGSLRLCDRESPLDCAQCFPEKGARDFFLRKRYIQTFLEDVDLFLTPSQFLANRYIAWGLPADKIMMLENMPPQAPGTEPGQARSRLASDALFGHASESGPTGETVKRAGRAGTQTAKRDEFVPRKLRFGFFGQMSPLKGISVLIDAAKILHDAEIEAAGIEIHGDYSNQPLEYQEAVKAALEQAGPNVVYIGRYENTEVRRLMSRVDAVIVPSIWWENSPVVIQEAYSCGKPVICSNIGGMAEKVRDGIDGLHFEAGRPQHLARLLANLAERPQILDQIARTVARPLDQAAALDAHLAAYARVLG